MSGWARVNSGRSSVTTSPSRPIAQSRRVVSPEDGERHAAPSQSVPITTRSAARDSVVRPLVTGRGEPAPREAGPLQAATQVRIVAHHAPDQASTIVLDHREQGPLVDPEVIAIDPAKRGDLTSVPKTKVEVEGKA